MVDFTAVAARLKPHHDNPLRVSAPVDGINNHQQATSLSAVAKVARQMIVARPKSCIVIAAVMGGILGWLTTKK